MKKVKFRLSALLMLGAMIWSDRPSVLIIYFLSAFLHELGHLAAAKARGIEVSEIRFDFSGVRICTDTGITSYKNEILLALAGPAINFIICLLLWILFVLNGHTQSTVMLSAFDFLSGRGGGLFGALGFMLACSLIQGVINLLPVKTFDGGRILECVIALRSGFERGARVISVTSALSSFVLWSIALYLMLRISSGIGIYAFSIVIFFSTFKDIEAGYDD